RSRLRSKADSLEVDRFAFDKPLTQGFDRERKAESCERLSGLDIELLRPTARLSLFSLDRRRHSGIEVHVERADVFAARRLLPSPFRLSQLGTLAKNAGLFHAPAVAGVGDLNAQFVVLNRLREVTIGYLLARGVAKHRVGA